MSKLRLRVELGGSWVSVHLTARRGLFRPTEIPCAHAVVPLEPGTANLPDALAALASDLVRQGARLDRADLEAHLGMSHARMGLMRLATAEKGPVAPALLQTYVAGWVQQMLHLNPGEQAIRWQLLRDPRHVLVSCVERSAFAALLQFAGTHKLRFTSCVPAALLAVREGRRLGPQTLLWTEGIGEQREACLQMFRFEGGQLSAAWRGWVPQATTDSSDVAAETALRRFEAGYPASAEHATLHRHWPHSPATTAI